MVINCSGAGLLGLCSGWIFARHHKRPWVRQFLGTGLLGAFTTFSTFMVDAFTLLRGAHVVYAIAYVAGSVVFGILAFAGGLSIGRSVHQAEKATT
jgi:CrcB protein